MRSIIKQFNLIEETVKNEKGVFSIQYGKGEFVASMIYGREAEDSPMAGAHAIALGKDMTEAINGMLDEMKKSE